MLVKVTKICVYKYVAIIRSGSCACRTSPSMQGTLEERSPGNHDVRHGLLHALSPSGLSIQWELWDRAAVVTDFSNNVMCPIFQAPSGQVCVFTSG